MASVFVRSLLATAAATASALALFFLSRWFFRSPYDWLNLLEATGIPILVAFPISFYIFYQNDRLADARVALAQQKKDSERHRMMIRELDHRVKNTLAVVASISAQAARSHVDIQSFLADFNGRLGALAAAHNLLSREGWSEIGLSELLAEVLSPFVNSIHSEGPEVRLDPAVATSLSMIFHELATNAAKYGSLSTAGSVSIEWALDRDLQLTWTEKEGPEIEAPAEKTGFGLKLVDLVVCGELGGSYRADYLRNGLVFQMRVPRERLTQTTDHS